MYETDEWYFQYELGVKPKRTRNPYTTMNDVNNQQTMADTEDLFDTDTVGNKVDNQL
ncbi:hypothetical protein [Ammoniphilus resinae]|uniref:Uncharacterized protein n=1 Tax=Ammoniphilus resinae TaxID=861532 RepID=A0ABS4GIR0_9BACL|nr:hypothetical protein [Ammoniphilus resinae]MBP1930137.1 hypothetical protein [Ammoniphilus resinae]